MDPLSEKRPVSLVGVPRHVVRYIRSLEKKALRYQLLLESRMREMDTEVECEVMERLRGTSGATPTEESSDSAGLEAEGSLYIEEDGYSYQLTPPDPLRGEARNAAIQHLDDISRRYWASLRRTEGAAASRVSSGTSGTSGTSGVSGVSGASGLAELAGIPEISAQARPARAGSHGRYCSGHGSHSSSGGQGSQGKQGNQGGGDYSGALLLARSARPARSGRPADETPTDSSSADHKGHQASGGSEDLAADEADGFFGGAPSEFRYWLVTSAPARGKPLPSTEPDSSDEEYFNLFRRELEGAEGPVRYEVPGRGNQQGSGAQGSPVAVPARA